RVTTFETGLAAVALKAHDIYLVDYQLGARTGLELIRECRRLGSTAPFVVLTGHGDATADRDATSAGASDYLEKAGLTPRLLERSVRNALERSRITSELASRARQQAAVAEVGQTALSGLELGRVFDEALVIVTRLLDAPCAELKELLAGGHELLLRAGLGWRAGEVGASRVP